MRVRLGDQFCRQQFGGLVQFSRSVHAQDGTERGAGYPWDAGNLRELLVMALCDMTASRTRGWWEEYRQILPAPLLDLAEVEHHARHLRTAGTVHIPGLLQTREHARVIFRQDVPELAPPDIEHRISLRIKRQADLFRESPAARQFVIHEAALSMRFGGPEVTGRHLRHLLDMSGRDHVTIQVIPFSAGAFAGSGQSIHTSKALYQPSIPGQLLRVHRHAPRHGPPDESSAPSGAILQATPAAWAAPIRSVKTRTDRG